MTWGQSCWQQWGRELGCPDSLRVGNQHHSHIPWAGGAAACSTMVTSRGDNSPTNPGGATRAVFCTFTLHPP